MRKIFFTVVFFSMVTVLTPTSMLEREEYIYCGAPQTHRDYAIERASRIFPLNDVTVAIVDVCLEESVPPLDVLAFIKVENSNLNPRAINRNMGTKWIKKSGRWVEVSTVFSTDAGIGQLNSTYIKEFEWFYWVCYGETEKFDVYNYIHNIKISVRLYKELYKCTGDSSLAIMAYNAGLGRVLKGDIPEVTQNVYLPRWQSYKDEMEN